MRARPAQPRCDAGCAGCAGSATDPPRQGEESGKAESQVAVGRGGSHTYTCRSQRDETMSLVHEPKSRSIKPPSWRASPPAGRGGVTRSVHFPRHSGCGRGRRVACGVQVRGPPEARLDPTGSPLALLAGLGPPSGPPPESGPPPGANGATPRAKARAMKHPARH